MIQPTTKIIFYASNWKKSIKQDHFFSLVLTTSYHLRFFSQLQFNLKHRTENTSKMALNDVVIVIAILASLGKKINFIISGNLI